LNDTPRDAQRSFPDRARAFVKRHAWSLPLASLSALCFVELAREVGAGRLGPLDRALTDFFKAGRGQWDLSMLTLTGLGNFPSLVALCSAAVVLLAYLGWRREARYLAVCGIGAALGNALLKVFFHRARPLATSVYLVEIPDSFSFPSGHAMGSTCVIGSLVVVGCVLTLGKLSRALVIIAGASLIAGVGVSRIYFGVHYPSDVIGGQLGGAAWVAAITGWFYPRLLPGEATAAAAP
jgi:undecaprenyl-diphosphatase